MSDHLEFRKSPMPAAMRARWIASQIKSGYWMRETTMARAIETEIREAERNAFEEAKEECRAALDELDQYRRVLYVARPGKTKISRCEAIFVQCIDADPSDVASQVDCHVSVAHEARRRVKKGIKNENR
jgi:hypothetical protein